MFFFKLKKSEKNSEMGGWAKPFFLNLMFFLFFCVVVILYKFSPKKLGYGVCGWGVASLSFPQIFVFF